MVFSNLNSERCTLTEQHTCVHTEKIPHAETHRKTDIQQTKTERKAFKKTQRENVTVADIQKNTHADRKRNTQKDMHTPAKTNRSIKFSETGR